MRKFVAIGLSLGVLMGCGGLASNLSRGNATEPRNPLGEVANYQVDRARSSNMLLEGSGKATVASLTEDGTGYNVPIDYAARIALLGWKRGTENTVVPLQFFTPEFWQDLRETGAYEAPDFKIQYLGLKTTKTLDGRTYVDCDYLKIYDIQTDQVQNAVAFIYHRDEVPVLGAVKVDGEGDHPQAGHVKIGLDYKAL